MGLYGDPNVSWSIVTQAELTRVIDAESVQAAMIELATRHSLLGGVPHLHVVPKSELAQLRDGFADAHFDGAEPLWRVALSQDGRSLVVGCHHGVVDGLGLLGIVGSLLDSPVQSEAQGVGGTAPRTGFVRGSVARLTEALFRPPRRVMPRTEGDGGSTASGDWLVTRERPAFSASTAKLVRASAATVDKWNSRQGEGRSSKRPVILAVGASRREPKAQLVPERRTAFLRLIDVQPDVTVAETRTLLRDTAPQPDFPATTGWGLGPLVTRLLSARLGSTMLLSNLGPLSADDAIRSLAFFPVTGGPRAVAVGLSTIGATTTLTVRARRDAFSRRATEVLADLLCGELSRACQ